MSYALISTSLGGKVRLQWRYSPPSDYYINIQIPRTYQNSNFPPEYPMLSDGDIMRSLRGAYSFSADGSGTRVAYDLAVELVIPLPGFVKRRAEMRILSTLKEQKSRSES
jgi:hypothetical protein